MLQLVTKRLAAAVAILLVLSAAVFLLQKLSHTDPVHAYLGANASKAAIAHERHVLGYDRPLVDQYVHYIGGLFTGSLGYSLRTRRPVGTDLAAYLPATLELSLFGLFLAVVLGALLGLASAGRWRGAGGLRALMVSFASAPSFLLAALGILFFYSKLHWLPATGRTSIADAPTGPTRLLLLDGLLHGRFDVVWDAYRHLLLPGLCIAVGPAVAIGRVLRGSLASNLRADYVRTARAKGLTEVRILIGHTLRNSIGAALSMTGLQAGLMFAGVVVIETIFAWPGVGLYTEQSIPAADFPAIGGVTLVLGVAYVLINTLVDLAQAVADPRVALT